MRSKPFIKIKHELDILVEKALENCVFSGCSVGYFYSAGDKIEEYHLSYGYTEKQKRHKVDIKTFYDLASLTKPLVTSLSIVKLVEEKKLNFEDSLGRFYNDVPLKNASVKSLLNHSSGLCAHRDYAPRLLACPPQKRKAKIVEWILKERQLYIPDSDSLYSDLGYILLGDIVERVSGKSLDVFWREYISAPLGLENRLFFNENNSMDSRDCVATGRCSWSDRRLCGLVNDDNCRALHGTAGHAGLFGNVQGLLELLKYIFKENMAGRFPSVTENRSTIKPGSWYYGFDTPSPGMSSSGKFFSDQTVGHLGFTGTSFWLDLYAGICVVLLTNRVIYGEKNNKIRKFRPLLHDIILSNIKKEPVIK
jgi:CubicO group peptidase (beta-lactamase class C family)